MSTANIEPRNDDQQMQENLTKGSGIEKHSCNFVIYQFQQFFQYNKLSNQLKKKAKTVLPIKIIK